MSGILQRERIINTITSQLETDLFLGGKWLPTGKITIEQGPGNRATRRPANRASQVAQGTAQGAANMEKAPVTASNYNQEKELRLKALLRNIEGCKKCALHEHRINIVPGEGNPDARIMFVGEAPGQNEDEMGRPFVGRAGKLLTKIIEAMGLRRSDVYIANIIKCRPPGNRDPLADEIVACVDYLTEQIEIIEPEIIIALGAHAARTLLNTNAPIGQLRGRIMEYQPSPLAQPIKLMATYHPAYLLRNYSQDNRLRVWHDMQAVLKFLGMPVPKRGS